MKRITYALALLLAILGTLHTVRAAQAQTTEQKPATADAMTDGEIRRIDKDAKKLTIRHGPIRNLDMPAMTMVFQVKDAAMLDKVNAGDKIRFSAERIGGVFTVVAIELVR
jgi:Cu(I)/Ag(I) efflux system protein CusF